METVLAIAGEVASWRGAVSVTPQWPLGAMLALSFGGLWLCLSRAPWRLAGIAAIPLAVAVVAGAARPQIFVAASGRNAGVVMAGAEELIVYSRRRDKFSAGVWKEALGYDRDKAPSVLMDERASCDGGGCVMEMPGEGEARPRIISFLSERALFEEDCARADLVVAFFPVSGAEWRACEAVLIDRRSIWRRGAHAVRVDGDEFRIRTVGEARGARPWTGDY